MQKIIIGELLVDTEENGKLLIGEILNENNMKISIDVYIHSWDETKEHKEFHELFDGYKTVKITIEGVE